MTEIRAYLVDAFTPSTFGGNVAGVVLDADQLTEHQMQLVAREMNQPESAFLLPATQPEAHFKVRYFTPASEIQFCGHATVAMAWVLASQHQWLEKTDQIIFETNVGLVPVDLVTVEGQLQLVRMTQVAPKTKDLEYTQGEIASLVGIPEDQIDERFPIKLGFTGNWHLLIPVKSRQAIDEATPNLVELARHNQKLQIATTHLFTFDTMDSTYDVYTRDFAPAVGIPEDPVTGAANGALAGYFAMENIIPIEQTKHLTIGQGHAIGRAGTLYVTITSSDQRPIIQVAGQATITFSGSLFFS